MRRLMRMDRFLKNYERLLDKLEAVNCNEYGRVQNAEVGKVGDCERKKPCTVTRIPSWNTKSSRQ